MTDEEAVALLAGELRRTEPMELVLRPSTVLELTALVQLALRHPGVDGAVRAAGDRFLVGVREYFADCPATLDIVRQGDDPTHDR
jgi:hypothetical protein